VVGVAAAHAERARMDVRMRSWKWKALRSEVLVDMNGLYRNAVVATR